MAHDSFAARHYTAQDGLRLYYRDYGDPLSARTPVLCLAGLARNSKDFDLFAARLASERRVLCPDYRGRGRSAYDPDWRNYQPRTYLNDLLHLLTLAGVHRAVVVGTSMGGLLAMGLAVLQPTVLAGVVLNDIGPEINGNGLARVLGYLGRDHPQPDWPAAVAFVKANFPGLAFDSDENWLRAARATFREGDDGRLHFDWDVAIARRFERPADAIPELWPVFRALGPIPTLALRGDRSDLLAADTFERMRTEKPDLTCVTIPGIGHAPTLDEPAARAALDAFLRGF